MIDRQKHKEACEAEIAKASVGCPQGMKSWMLGNWYSFFEYAEKRDTNNASRRKVADSLIIGRWMAQQRDGRL